MCLQTLLLLLTPILYSRHSPVIFSVSLDHRTPIAKDFGSSPFSCLEISPSSSTGPQGCTNTTKGPLLSGRHSPGLFPSGLRNTRACSASGPSFHPPMAICHPRQQVSAVKESLCMPMLGHKIWDKAEFGPCATAEVLQPRCAPMPSAWGTGRRSWIPACCHRAGTWMEELLRCGGTGPSAWGAVLDGCRFFRRDRWG